MKNISFLEYIDSKKKIRKPVVDPTGDQTDPKNMPKKPPKSAKKYKCSDGKPTTAKGKEWGNLGDKSLVYKPDVKNVNGTKPAKIPTAEQVKIANAMADDITFDPTLLETVVDVLEKRGLLGFLVAEVFEHKDSCKHLSEILTHESYGHKLFRNLSKALNEESASPYVDQLEGEDEEDEDEDDPFADEDESEDEDNEDEEDDQEDGAPVMPSMDQSDPNMMGGMDPNAMDPNMMPGMDPNAMDPNMMGGQMGMPQMGMPQMQPPQMQPPQMQPPQMGMPQMGMPQMQPPQQPVMPMMMRQFQKAYQRANMRAR